MTPRVSRMPNAVVELLRLCVVVFFAGLGYEIALVMEGSGHRSALGGVDPLWVGLLLGSSLGFVLGGVLGRATERTVSRTERSLHEISAEHIVAGVFGSIIGVVAASAVAWPVFLIGDRLLAVPLFAFVLVTLALLGYRVGVSRRDGMLGLFGASAGLPPLPISASTLPRIVDTSIAIDGRIIDVIRAVNPHIIRYPSELVQQMGPGSFCYRLGMNGIVAFVGWLSVEVVGKRFSVMRQFGRTSLLVYWIHVDLCYGLIAHRLGLYGRLSMPQATVGLLTMIALMLGVSVAKTRWRK